MRQANFSLEEVPVATYARTDARLRRLIDDYFDFIGDHYAGWESRSTQVDDSAQRVFFIAAKNLHLIAPASERSYLFGTCVRVASDTRRVLGRIREVEGQMKESRALHIRPRARKTCSIKSALARSSTRCSRTCRWICAPCWFWSKARASRRWRWRPSSKSQRAQSTHGFDELARRSPAAWRA